MHRNYICLLLTLLTFIIISYRIFQILDLWFDKFTYLPDYPKENLNLEILKNFKLKKLKSSEIEQYNNEG